MPWPWLDQMLKEARWRFVLGLLAVAVAVGLYFEAGLFGFCDLDDPTFVSANPLVLSGLSLHSLRLALLPDGVMYWSPLCTLSFLVDSSLFRFWPGGFHLTNVLLHGGNVALFFLLALRLSGSRWAATLAALLFAAHPAHVEAVAWISARKDVLSTFWGLAAIHLYSIWTRRPGAWASLGLHGSYLLSLLAKPMFVTLPGLLLLLDFWPLGRLSPAPGRPWPGWRELLPRLREKALLLALGLFITFMALNSHIDSRDRLDPDLALKLANALVSYVKYLSLLVLPANLAIMHPFPDAVPLAQSLGSAALLLGLTGLCLWQARVRPYLLVGWLWFLCSLLPVIMPPKMGIHVAYAERWTYVPFLGLYLALGCLGAEALRAATRPLPRACAALALLLLPLLPLAAAQQRQLATWATAEGIYERALRVTTGNYLILNNYGVLKSNSGEDVTAERSYREALRIFPEYSSCQHNLGLLCLRQGRHAEALELLWSAMEREAKAGRAYQQYRALAQCMIQVGRPAEAQAFFARAVREQPGRPEAYAEWGAYAKRVGDEATARAFFQAAQQGALLETGAPLSLERLRAVMPRP